MGLRKQVIQEQQQVSDWKESARFVIDGESIAAYTRIGNVITADGLTALAAQDGVTPQAGDRAVLDFDSPNADSGLYVVTQVGVDAASPFIFTRDTDFDDDDKVTAGIRIPIEEGTAFGGQKAKLVTTGAITINTTPIDFELDAGGGGGSAGFTLVPVGEVKTIEENEQVLVTGPKVEGQLFVRGQMKLLAPANPRVVVPVVKATLVTPVPNNSSVPVDPRAGALSVTLPNKGTPGETVMVQNVTGSTNVITILAGGYPINGANEVTMNTPNQRAEFIRQPNQTWVVNL